MAGSLVSLCARFFPSVTNSQGYLRGFDYFFLFIFVRRLWPMLNDLKLVRSCASYFAVCLRSRLAEQAEQKASHAGFKANP